MTGEPPSSSGADQVTLTLVPDTVADTAPGAAGTVRCFVLSADTALSRDVYRAVRVPSDAASSATASFAAVSAAVNAFQEASV